jgi:O-antigen ligase
MSSHRLLPIILGLMLVALAVILGLIVTILPSNDSLFLVIGVVGLSSITIFSITGRKRLNLSLDLRQDGPMASPRSHRKTYDPALLAFYAGMATIAFLPFRISIFPLSDIFFFTSFCVAFGRRSASENPQIKLPSGLLAGITVFTGGAIVTSFFSSTDPTASFLALVQFLFATALWFYTAGLVLRETHQILTAMRWWVISAAICALWAVGQKIGVLPGLQPGNSGRAAGLAEQVNNLGGICAISLLPAIGLIYLGKSNADRLFSVSTLTIIGAGLVASGSISAAVGAICGLTVGLFAMELTRSITRTLAVAAIAFAIASHSGNLTGNQLSRFSTTINPNAQNGQDSFYSRLNVIETAWQQHIRVEPFIGVGLDKQSNLIYSEVSHASHQVHNLFIGDWYEVGLLGFIGILLIVFSVVKTGWQLAQSSPTRNEQIFALTLLGSTVTFIVFAMGEPIRDQRFAIVPACLVMALYSVRFAAMRNRETARTHKAAEPPTSPARLLLTDHI